MNKIGVFAGSFDPFTIGHFDIVSRAAGIFDKIYIGVAASTGAKNCVLTLQERTNVVKESVKELKNVEVMSFDSFLVNFAKSVGASFIVRGLRTLNDFEYEKSLNEVYKSQNPEIETFYLISSHNYSHVSSTIVRELAIMGGNLNGYVHKNVRELVEKMYRS